MKLDRFTANWNYPTSVRSGIGRIQELADVCQELEMTSPLMVTDPGLAALSPVQTALQVCRDSDLNCGLFSAIKGNPNGKNMSDGVVAFKTGNHDGVIAIGEGSALDAAKAIALMVAIPTTAGTGSEVGRASVNALKRSFSTPKCCLRS